MVENMCNFAFSVNSFHLSVIYVIWNKEKSRNFAAVKTIKR